MLTHEHDLVSRTNVLALAPTNGHVLIRHMLEGFFGRIAVPTRAIETTTFNHLIIL